VRAPIAIPLMSPPATVANNTPAKVCPARPIPAVPSLRSMSTMLGTITRWPGWKVHSTVAVLSGVWTTSALKRKVTVLATSEKLVTISSLVKTPVSTITGRVCPVVPASELSVTGKTKEPSELAWSLMTP